MPIYEYSCNECTTTFERLLKISEMTTPLNAACPECQASDSISQNATRFSQGDPIKLGIRRPDSGWGEVLSKVQAAHPKGKLGERFIPTRTV